MQIAIGTGITIINDIAGTTIYVDTLLDENNQIILDESGFSITEG